MKVGAARILEDTIRQARAKVLTAAGELTGKEYDRARCRLQVAAWQLGKLAEALRRARKEKADPVERLLICEAVDEELRSITGELRCLEVEVSPWPVRAWARLQRRLGELGARHGRAFRRFVERGIKWSRTR